MSAAKIDWNDPKYNDPMEEIYAIRRMISEEYEHDVLRYGAAVREETARAKALGMTYGQYYLAKFEGTLPLCACEKPAEYKAGRELKAFIHAGRQPSSPSPARPAPRAARCTPSAGSAPGQTPLLH